MSSVATTEVSEVAGFPRVIALPLGGELRLAAPPRRVLPTNASALDFTLTAAAPDAIVALSPVSIDYSLAARGIEWKDEQLIGRYTGESVLATQPDLVVNHAWQDAAVTEFVRRSGIPILTLPEVNSLDDITAVIELMGTVFGSEEVSTRTVKALRDRVRALDPDGRFKGLRMLAFSHYGSGGSCAGTGTTYDLIFKLAGLTNAAAEYGLSGFAETNDEKLIDIQPDWIVVGVSAKDPSMSASEEFLRNEPALVHMDAVRAERFIRLPAALYATSSQYLVDAAEALIGELEGRVEAAGGSGR